MKHKSVLTCLLLLVGMIAARAQNTTVTWGNFDFDATSQSAVLLRDGAGNPLSQGVANVNTDGFLVQLGYYTGATAANPFAGTWIPITGAMSAARTAIGDSQSLSGSGAGVIDFVTLFNSGTSAPIVYPGQPGTYVTSSSVTITTTTPPNGQIMSIRFYDTTDGASGHFNAVSASQAAGAASSWAWAAPSTQGSTANFQIGDLFDSPGGLANLIFQDNANPFKTTLLVAIPEPTTLALLGVGLAGVALMRRRAKVA